MDTATPFTVVAIAGTGQRIRGELRLQDAEVPELTRFIFRDLEVFDLSPQPVGVAPGLPVQAVVGFSLLRHFAVRLSYAAGGAITFRDEIPDSNPELASDCDPSLLLQPGASRPGCLAVFNTIPAGGGLVEVGGDSLELPASRLVLPLCLLPDPFDPVPTTQLGPERTSGVSVLAVLATGQPLSVISRSALEQLRAGGASLVESLPVTLHLPYGVEEAPLVYLERTAVVSNETIELGACAELARRRRLLVASRAGVREDDADRHGAAVALVQRLTPFAVLDDTRPLIQWLRQELQPFTGSIDVVLGGSFLRHFELDLDYPARRVILQCSADQAPSSCQVLPFCGADFDPRCPARQP